jgi:hypothetical protein
MSISSWKCVELSFYSIISRFFFFFEKYVYMYIYNCFD